MNGSAKSMGLYRSFQRVVSWLLATVVRLVSTVRWNKNNIITIFGRDVAIGTSMKRSGHERPFADLIEVDELRYNSAQSISDAAMAQCISAVMSYTQPTSSIEGAVQLFVFTTDDYGPATTISLDRSHAFSILTFQENQLRHHYFEKRGQSAFQEVPSLSMTIPSPFDMDDIRLLHFAAVGEHGLPLRSTIYELNSGSWAFQHWTWKKNTSLRVSILRDPTRYWGASTLGLYGDEIYLAFLGKAGSYCGGNRDCPEGSDKTCGTAPGGPDKVCGAVSVGGDLLVDITRELRMHTVAPVPVDFVLSRSIRKTFLERYPRGWEYISYYYIAALFAKFDMYLLDQYAEAMPHIEIGMKELLSGSGEAIIVTTALRDSLTDIIDSHRDVEDPDFQAILDAVEKVLKNYHGMTKSQLIGSLVAE